MSFEIKAPQLVEAIEHFIDSVDNRLDGYDQKLEVFEADIPTQLFARLRITGCQLRTVKYTAAQVSAGIEVWHSSLISTFGSIGKVFLEHCLVTLNNGALMHQHTGGSIGLADLYMRNVTIGLTDRTTLATTAGWPYLIAKYLDGKMPFFVYGIEMTRLNGLTWTYLLNVDLTHAITNLKD